MHRLPLGFGHFAVKFRCPQSCWFLRFDFPSPQRCVGFEAILVFSRFFFWGGGLVEDAGRLRALFEEPLGKPMGPVAPLQNSKPH